MLSRTPINCPKCGEFVINSEDMTYLYIQPPGIKCKCGALVVASTEAIY